MQLVEILHKNIGKLKETIILLLLLVGLIFVEGCKKEGGEEKEKIRLLAEETVDCEYGKDQYYKTLKFYVDAKGNVYIGDVYRMKIDKFSKDGRFLRSIGKAGEGPGEFSTFLPPFAVNSRGAVVVSDFFKKELMFFSPDGKYKATVKTPESFPHIIFTLDDRLILASEDTLNVRKYYMYDSADKKFIFLMEDKSRALKKPLGSVPIPMNPVAFTGDEVGNVYIADSLFYRIYVFNKEGKLTKIFERKWDFEEITEKDYYFDPAQLELKSDEIEFYKFGASLIVKEVKKRKSPVRLVPAIIDLDYSGGKLYVWTSRVTDGNKFVIDVYSKDLRFLERRFYYNYISSQKFVFIRGNYVYRPTSLPNNKMGRASFILALASEYRPARSRLLQ